MGGYTELRPQIIYPDGRVAYLVDTASTQPTTEQSKETASLSKVTSSTGSGQADFTGDLSLHAKEDRVREMQKYLNKEGYTIARTGVGSLGNETTYFGPATYSTVVKFQKERSKATPEQLLRADD